MISEIQIDTQGDGHSKEGPPLRRAVRHSVRANLNVRFLDRLARKRTTATPRTATALLEDMSVQLVSNVTQMLIVLPTDSKAMGVGIHSNGIQQKQERIKKLKVCIRIILR